MTKGFQCFGMLSSFQLCLYFIKHIKGPVINISSLLFINIWARIKIK